MSVSIQTAQFPRDTAIIHTLFSGYAASLGIDLTFQSFQDELDTLPGKYDASQGGALLIARKNTNAAGEFNSTSPTTYGQALGCVALRRSSDNWGEMKRLYVLPESRGLKLGDQLVVAILERAKELGYRGIRLDTLPDMTAAQRLYRRYGFTEISSYYDTPIENTLFMGCDFLQE